MNKKIENIDQLRAEIKRLEGRNEELKTTLKNDAEGIKDFFRPVNLFFNTAASFAKMKFAPPIFSSNGFAEGVRSIIAPIIEKIFDRISTAIAEFLKRRKNAVHEDD
jgi:hypothetical protein